jgi:O-antigen ligase
LALAFVAGASIAGLWAVAQTLSGSGLVAAEGVGRAGGPYPSPNNLALLLERAFPLALALAVYGPRGEGGEVRPGEGRGVRFATTLAALLCGVALGLTFSRGAWLATLVAAGVVFAPVLVRLTVAQRRRLALVATAVTLPLLLAAGALAARYERFGSLLNPQGTGLLRLSVWRASFDMLRDHPLWGVGLDQFLYHYPRYMRPEAWREPNLSHPHNLAFDFWLRLGLLGLAALGWLAYTFVRLARRQLRAWPVWPSDWAARRRGAGEAGFGDGWDVYGGALVLGAVAAATAAVVHGLVDNFYFVADLAYALWIVALVVELCDEHAGGHG